MAQMIWIWSSQFASRLWGAFDAGQCLAACGRAKSARETRRPASAPPPATLAPEAARGRPTRGARLELASAELNILKTGQRIVDPLGAQSQNIISFSVSHCDKSSTRRPAAHNGQQQWRHINPQSIGPRYDSHEPGAGGKSFACLRCRLISSSSSSTSSSCLSTLHPWLAAHVVSNRVGREGSMSSTSIDRSDLVVERSR